MDLKAKLARLSTAGPGSAAAEAPPTSERDARLAQLRRMIGAVARGTASRPRSEVERPSAAELPAEREETPHGPVFVHRRVLPSSHRHGRAAIERACGATLTDVASLALDDTLRAPSGRGWLFLDTETTGLAGGTGTLPFVVGLSTFQGQQLHVEQLLLAEPGHERAMLRRIAERLEVAPVIVSFNGKSFDWPLLRTRFVMNRVPMPPIAGHVDLLHVARRVWRERVGEVRLVHLEREVLGFEREDDIHGHEIPEVYFEFLREGRSARFRAVVEHNALDLIALPALLGELVALYRAPADGTDVRDQLGLARVALRANDPERAASFARAARERAEPEVVGRALLLEANAARARGDFDAEARILERVRGDGCEERARLDACLRLAKYYEHRRRDFDAALACAQELAAKMDHAGVAARIARLERKRTRSEGR